MEKCLLRSSFYNNRLPLSKNYEVWEITASVLQRSLACQQHIKLSGLFLRSKEYSLFCNLHTSNSTMIK